MINENSPIYQVATQSEYIRAISLEGDNLILHTNQTFDGYDLVDLVLAQDDDGFILTELGEYVEEFDLDQIKTSIKNSPYLSFDGECIYCFADEDKLLERINDFMALLAALKSEE